MEKSEIKNIRLYEENGRYYLSLNYIYEDDNSIKEFEIPKVKLPFSKNSFLNIKSDYYDSYGRVDHYLIVNNANFELCRAECSMEGVFGEHEFVFKTIEKKATEMTISEIEKRLGYKIKIVSEDKKESKNA